PGFFDEGPEMNVVAVNIRAPGNDVARMRKLFRLGTKLDANHRFQAFFTGAGADAALQLRSAQPVEEAPVHGTAVERGNRAPVRIGQDGFKPVFSDNPTEAMCNFVKRLIPGDPLKRARWRDGRPRPSLPQGSRSLRSHPSHRIQHSLRRVHAVQIFGNFGAKKSARNRVLGIALNSGSPAVFDGDQDAAGVRAIVRAGSVDDALHPRIIMVETGIARSRKNKEEARFGRLVVRLTSKLSAIVQPAVPAPGPPPPPACR